MEPPEEKPELLRLVERSVTALVARTRAAEQKRTWEQRLADCPHTPVRCVVEDFATARIDFASGARFEGEIHGVIEVARVIDAIYQPD